MKIVDMARDPESYDAVPMEPSPYPCGLRISLDEDALKKLGIDTMPELGAQVAFYVCGEVCSTSESNEYGEHKCMGVQIQQMAIEELPDEEEAEDEAAEKAGFKETASKLYPKQKG